MSQFIVLPDGGGAAAAVARSFYVQVDPQVLVRARIHGMLNRGSRRRTVVKNRIVHRSAWWTSHVGGGGMLLNMGAG